MSTLSLIRIVLVDDHAVLRAGLVSVLNSEPGMQVVAEATDGPTAIELWRKHRPDVTLLDISMAGSSANGGGSRPGLREIRQEGEIAIDGLSPDLSPRSRNLRARFSGEGDENGRKSLESRKSE